MARVSLGGIQSHFKVLVMFQYTRDIYRNIRYNVKTFVIISYFSYSDGHSDLYKKTTTKHKQICKLIPNSHEKIQK